MQLTENEVLELSYMKALGMNCIARDKSGEMFAYEDNPHRFEKAFLGKGNYLIKLGEYDFIKWEDEPIEINKLLIENGLDIHLVYPPDIEE